MLFSESYDLLSCLIVDKYEKMLKIFKYNLEYFFVGGDFDIHTYIFDKDSPKKKTVTHINTALKSRFLVGLDYNTKIIT